jgi:hypothetical protein
MPHRTDISCIAVIGVALMISSCATARMHSETELNSVATTCGLALGQLAQDEEEKRLLFIMEANPSAERQVCVKKWARRNGLKPVFIDGVEFAQ